MKKMHIVYQIAVQTHRKRCRLRNHYLDITGLQASFITLITVTLVSSHTNVFYIVAKFRIFRHA